jgi:hypothetical protein
MKKDQNAIDVFHQFAEDRLKNHFEELKTRYENESLGSDRLKRQAYMDHQKIYSQELDEKIKYLLNDPGNVWLKGEMENLKHTYVAKFSLNQS